MSFELEFLEMMPHEIQVFSFVGEDFRGKKTYDPAVPPGKLYKCRIVGKGIALRTRAEEQDTVIYDVYIGPRIEGGKPVLSSLGDAFRVEDRIVLPVDVVWTDQTPEIFAVARETDEDGHHHTKIQCGWMYHRQGQ